MKVRGLVSPGSNYIFLKIISIPAGSKRSPLPILALGIIFNEMESALPQPLCAAGMG
jgi:hypothetical protein